MHFTTPSRAWRTALTLAAGLLLAFAGTTPASAQQSPTPEGTEITNTATVSWTDANGNDYTPVDASASVTVGFQAGLDVTGTATVTPESPSTDNTLAFTIENIGNGTDSVTVAESVSDPWVTPTGYTVNGGTTYTSLSALNTALASESIAMGGTLTIDVTYDVDDGHGGETATYDLTATSRRDNSVDDTFQSSIEPPAAAGVEVTPDGATADRLPSNGTSYTETFTVENTGNQDDTFDLVASANPGSAITIVSVDGQAGASTSIAVTQGNSQDVDVVYEVGDVAAGTEDTLELTATSQADGGVSDAGDVTVTVQAGSVSITVEPYRDDQSTLITSSDRVLPDEFIWYKITVTNDGDVDAESVHVDDDLPAEVIFDQTQPDGSGWTINESGGSISADLSGSLTVGSSRHFWVRVQIR